MKQDRDTSHSIAGRRREAGISSHLEKYGRSGEPLSANHRAQGAGPRQFELERKERAMPAKKPLAPYIDRATVVKYALPWKQIHRHISENFNPSC